MRRSLLLTALTGGSVLAVAAAGLIPAASASAHSAAASPDRVITVAGDLQSELGCPSDWTPACDQSELAPTGATSYASQFALPAGSYQFKVTVNGAWDENYGAGGVANGSNIPLVLTADATVKFSYDDVTHVVSVSPLDLPGSKVTAADRALAATSVRQPLTREQFYFVMTDRFANGDPGNDKGGLTGGPLETGLDPTHKGFYHGGDLLGLIGKLDYIKKLGTTAIWLTPSFVNKPVQGTPGTETAGYHGYWITDFTHIDPHLGTNADMKALINQAHQKGMKVFFDIITNHTADVIDYAQKQYTYIPKADAPYKDANGNVFDDRDYVESPDFPEMNAQSFPYTPVFDNPADATAKTPAWLNDPTLYHNRGDSTFAGESSNYGDFVGLDDLFTENPKVLHGMEDIYKTWVDFGIDGFRIDTAKHVNTEFWQQFSPAMLDEAASIGNPDFFMFGEVADNDPAFQSIYSTTAKLPATLDFGFQAQAVGVANGGATKNLANLFANDDYYTDTDSNAYDLPTFLGNHDMGRVGKFVGGDMAKDVFAHGLMYTLRGQPVVYYGDEQGFIGDGGDQDARQDMFASQVASYNDDAMIGGPTGSMDRYGTNGPMYKAIQQLSALRKDNPTLADGAQIARYASNSAGIFAVSRVAAGKNVEYLVVANNADTAKTATFSTYTKLGKFAPVYGGGNNVWSDANSRVTVTVPPGKVRVYKAAKPILTPTKAPLVGFQSPAVGAVLSGRQEVRAAVPANTFNEVTFAYRPVGTTAWTKLGTDDNAPYRVFQDVSDVPAGTMYEYRTVVRDSAGHYAATSSYGTVGTPAPKTGGPVGDVDQPNFVSIPGTEGAELGCAADWLPECDQIQLTLDTSDEIWKGTFDIPEGPYAYKGAIDKAWTENYGEGGIRDGANIEFSSQGQPITFYYDHRTHWMTSDAQTTLVVAEGSFQSEMGCPTDDSPSCMRSWLQDPDKDGVFTLSTLQIPAGTYDARAAIGLAEADGDAVPFTVDRDGLATNFVYDSNSHVLTISTSVPTVVPDLSTSYAYWIDNHNIAYPLDRLPAGVQPSWLRWRLHWGNLAIDATDIGGASTIVKPQAGGPDGYVRLHLNAYSASHVSQIKAAPIVGIGVYDDAGRLIDATGVGPHP